VGRGTTTAVKGLILSGGAGTRLRPITHTSAKQLVPVANKPILFYGLEDMAEAGIREVGIVIGETGDEIRAAVGDGAAWGLEVTYLPQDEPLGLAHCVLIAADFLGREDFVMYLGDNLLRDGVAEIGPDGEVLQLLEKPDEPPSDLALVGVYLFDATIHEAVAAIEPSPRGELEITDAIQWLIDHGHRVRHEILDGWWKDTGKLDPLLEGNRLILETLEPAVRGSVDGTSSVEGRVVVEDGAEIRASRVRGPAIIGAGTRIVNSYVGPYTSVAAGCEIIDSEIEHSVILENSRIVNIPHVQDSLIGREVEVVRSGRVPRATRLMLGDHSRVDIE
jgi:glucose-1-phosphate thymidylyltransferase